MQPGTQTVRVSVVTPVPASLGTKQPTVPVTAGGNASTCWACAAMHAPGVAVTRVGSLQLSPPETGIDASHANAPTM